MITVKVSRKARTMRFPASFSSFLDKGSEFLISKHGDTIQLKQIQEPIWRLADRIPDPDKPGIEEIDTMVHRARRELRRQK